MPQAVPTSLELLSAFVSGLVGGLVLGLWTRRRVQASRPADPECRSQLEALARAREASERANTELRQALDQMERTAATDRLTGAWNRRWFEGGAAQLIAVASRGEAPISLILYDLDHFKHINDTFGHPMGDRVLRDVTEAVRSQLRTSDALARWGGEEFIVLCPATTLAGATILAEKIRQAVEAQALPQVGMVTISLGVAQHHRAESLDAWILRADEALYRISNRLLSAVTSGQYPDDAKLQMQLLIAHVAQHFHDEEAILARVGYPELTAHAREHNRLIGQAKALQRQMGGDTADLPGILSYLALDLVKGHIIEWDRRFYNYLVHD